MLRKIFGFCKLFWIAKHYINNISYILRMLSSELNKCVDMATRTYENIVVMGDINIDMDDNKAIGQNKLSEFCDIFGLENLIQGSTCVTVRHEPTSIDVILTNKKRRFKNSDTVATWTGVSDYHKMILTTMRANYKKVKVNRQRPKSVI